MSKRKYASIACGLFLLVVCRPLSFSSMQASKETTKRFPFQNPSLPVEQRVEDLVSRMTLEEKVLQMQHTAPAIPRLGIPSYDWWNEALHGVARSGYATVFPQAIGMAATWDVDLIHQEAESIATEARAKYNQAQREGNHSIYYGLTFWSPNINIFRDPRWGRGQETYGEDPFLTGQMGLAFVTGLQGNDPKYLKTVATPKHYAVHSGPEPLRHGFNVNVVPRDLEETYLPAFRATLVDGRADSVMCSYNAVDGVPACASEFLLQKVLRDDWGFRGYVTSDCGAVGDITSGHHYTPDDEHGSALAVRAGTDTTCGNEYVTLVKAVQDGLIKESEIDTAVQRLFTARLRLGMFDPKEMVPFNRIAMSEVGSPQHRALALKVARESMVLLKNQDETLPLKPGVKTIAVIGPNAETLTAIEGNYNGVPSHPVLPIDGMLKQFASKAQVLYAQGSPHVPELVLPVPRSAFHPADGSEESGLKGEYFSNPDLSGQPSLTRTDPQIQFDWNAASPAAGVPMQAFSVRWSGTLTPPGPGEYTFSIRKFHCHRCEVDESVRVFLDNEIVIDSRQNTLPLAGQGVTNRSGFTRRPPEPSFHVRFTDTQPHSLRVEYTHRSDLFGAGLTLEWQPPTDVLREEAVKAAARADVVVAFVGLSPGLEGEEMPVHVEGFNGGDRTEIGLPPVQEDLLEALAATGKPLVVVLMSGSALAVNWADQHAAAILEAWYPGEEGGTAIAETIAGENNPGGKLPVTFYKSVDQLPPFEDYRMANRTYRYFKGEPLYPFGHGLSFTSFKYSDLKLGASKVKPNEDLQVTVTVQNTGDRPGDEVVQLYVRHLEARVPEPIRSLAGFSRIHLNAGEKTQVEFVLTPRRMSLIDANGRRIVEPGEFRIEVGGKQAGFHGTADAKTTGVLSAQFEVTGEVSEIK
jgi:beta-glucosidase